MIHKNYYKGGISMADLNLSLGKVENISSLVVNGGENLFSAVTDVKTVAFKLNKNQAGLRIEVKGNVKYVSVPNTVTVYGNIDYAEAQNSMEVEGFIEDYKCPRGSITINRDIWVCHGNEKLKRYNIPTKEFKVLHVNGDLTSLSFNAIGSVMVDVVIFGNVQRLCAGNCISCRGIIKNACAGNMLYMTASDKRTGKPTDALVKERKKSMESIDRNLSDIFSRI